MSKKTIYVSMASLPDKELLPTIDNIYLSAKNPENVFVGIVCIGFNLLQKMQAKKIASKYHNMSILFKDIPSGDFMKKKLKVLGISNGRNLAISLYKNQDYILQIDSHTMFAKDWDETLIRLHGEAIIETGNQKTVLTGYASSYTHNNGNREFIDTGFGYPVFVQNEYFFDFIPKWQTAHIIDERRFVPARKFNANFAFSDSSFAKIKTLPDGLVFFEEEIIQTMELLKNGFALCFPIVSEPIIGHLYTDHITSKQFSRKYVMSYAPGGDLRNSKDFHSVVRNNYFGYIKENVELAKKYEKYAKINLKLGPVSSDLYIPKSYDI